MLSYMYEHRGMQLIPTRRFLRRVTFHLAVATALVMASLSLGMAGYSHFERLALPDAFLNAAMLLGGMGPIDAPKTLGGKVFAGVYALYCGLVLLVAAGILFAPLLHRLLHHFHWLDEAGRR